MPLTRRRLLSLAAGGALALSCRRGLALGAASKFRIGHLKVKGDWNPRPGALRRLAWEIEKRTAVDAALAPAVLELGSPNLFDDPFLYLAGDRDFEMPAERDLHRLNRFLTFGGFLLIDSAEGSVGGAFDHSVRELMRAVFPDPDTHLELVPQSNVVYKSFYLLERPVGRVAVSPSMEGIFDGKRLMVAYVQNDLGGAWARDDFGNYLYPCEPGGERQREMAFRLGINLAMYALCGSYKEDQVHVPFIMRRRRWRADNDSGSESGPAPR